jgi:arylsulfatase
MKFKGPWELYDIEADRTEQRNIIAEHQDIAKKLKAQWRAWAKRTDVDPWDGPLRHDSGEPVKEDEKAQKG